MQLGKTYADQLTDIPDKTWFRRRAGPVADDVEGLLSEANVGDFGYFVTENGPPVFKQIANLAMPRHLPSTSWSVTVDSECLVCTDDVDLDFECIFLPDHIIRCFDHMRGDINH